MPRNTPLVSFVMPINNREKYFAQALESVFKDAYWPIEVIAIDDGSSDRRS